MKTFCLFTAFLFTFSLSLEGQNSFIDSLRSTLVGTFNDSARVSLLLQITDLSLKTSPHASETYALQAIEIAKKMNNTDFEGKALNLLGISQYQRQQFREAITSFDKVNKIFRKLKNHEKVSDALNNIGSARQMLEEYNNALNVLFSSLRIRDSLNLDAKKAVTLQNIGNTYSQMGKMIEGEKYLLESLAIRDKIGDATEIANSCLNLAVLYGKNEKYDLSLHYSTRAKIIKQKAGEKISVISICINQGNAYSKKGDIDLSYQAYSEAIRLSEEMNFRPGLSTSLMGIGVLFDTYEDYEKSIVYYNKALLEFSKQQHQSGIANCFENIGNAYFKMNSVPDNQSLPYFLKADSLYKKLNDLEGIGRVNSNIGTAYWKMGQYSKAIPVLEASIKINEKRGATSSTMNAHLSLGKCYLILKNIKNAEKHFRIAFDLGKQSKRKSVWSEAAAGLSKIQADRNQFESAYNLLKKSKELSDSIFNNEDRNTIYKKEGQKEKLSLVKHLKSKEAKRRKMVFLITALAILFVSVVFYIIWMKQNKELSLFRKQLLDENKGMTKAIDSYKMNGNLEQVNREFLNIRVIEKNMKLGKVTTSVKMKNISIYDIEYVESDRNNLKFKMTDGQILITRGTMENFAKDWSLPGIFERVGKSYMINFKHIDRWGRSTATMKSKIEIPIGKEFRETYIQIVQKMNTQS